MKIIGSMTTLPNRFEYLKTSIKYILRQNVPLDTLYVNIPYKTLKGKKYIIPKNFFLQFKGYSTKVVVNRCRDYGPITKLAPVLDIEIEPDTCIITFDDDIIIHKNVVKILCKKEREYSDSCIAFSGVCIGKFPFYYQHAVINTYDCNVDWIEGVHVVMYKRSFFSTLNDLVTFGNTTPVKNDLLFNDDHRISAYLANKGIDRISIGYDTRNYIFKIKEVSPDALSGNLFRVMRQHSRLINYFSNKGLYKHQYKFEESLGFLFILIICASFIVYKYTSVSVHFRLIFVLLCSIWIVKYHNSRTKIKIYPYLGLKI